MAESAQTILVYLENNGGVLPKSALVTIDAALKAKSAHGYSRTVGALLGNSGVADAAKSAAGYGLDEVIYVQSELLEHYLAVPFAEAILQIVKDRSPQLIVAAATSRGKDFLPRVAKALNAGQASDVMAFNSDKSFRRPMYAGNILADVEISTPIKVVTIRQTAFEAPKSSGAGGTASAFSATLQPCTVQKFIRFDTVQSERPELTEAGAVVSGGRALKSAENFEKVLAPLADVLGAALGASRAAVDSGYAPNDWQVGQTGKVVAPTIYIAVGISGAIQHLAGMKDSKVIVAINQDAEAPIFEVADYGLVGDLFKLIPELTEEIRKRKSVS